MQAHYQSTMRDEADSSYMAGFGDMNLQRARQARNMDDPRDEAAILRAHTAAATESRKRVKAEKKSVVPVKYTAVKPAPQPDQMLQNSRGTGAVLAKVPNPAWENLTPLNSL